MKSAECRTKKADAGVDPSPLPGIGWRGLLFHDMIAPPAHLSRGVQLPAVHRGPGNDFSNPFGWLNVQAVSRRPVLQNKKDPARGPVSVSFGGGPATQRRSASHSPGADACQVPSFR